MERRVCKRFDVFWAILVFAVFRDKRSKFEVNKIESSSVDVSVGCRRLSKRLILRNMVNTGCAWSLDKFCVTLCLFILLDLPVVLLRINYRYKISQY